jgi:hypothetical protein
VLVRLIGFINALVTSSLSHTYIPLYEPLLRNGLHNPVVPPLLGADDIENTVSSIVAYWTVFTELLPGNALIKSVTIIFIYLDI